MTNFKSSLVSLKYIGAYMNVVRKEKRVTRKALAERVGCSKRNIKDIEKGSPDVTIGVVFDCCSILGIDVIKSNIVDPAVMSEFMSHLVTIMPDIGKAKTTFFDEF